MQRSHVNVSSWAESNGTHNEIQSVSICGVLAPPQISFTIVLNGTSATTQISTTASAGEFKSSVSTGYSGDLMVERIKCSVGFGYIWLVLFHEYLHNAPLNSLWLAEIKPLLARRIVEVTIWPATTDGLSGEFQLEIDLKCCEYLLRHCWKKSFLSQCTYVLHTPQCYKCDGKESFCEFA